MLSKLVQNGLEPERTFILPFGLNLTHLANAQRPRPAETLRLGYIGTLFEHKGVHVLIEAVRQLAGKPIELKIYGKIDEFPDYTQKLKGLALDDPRIEFCGTFPNGEIGTIFSSLDVLVVPSLWHENSPLVLYSAQAAKCPVIASNVAGLSEVIEHGKNGFLFPPGNASELAHSILSLLENRALLEVMSKNSKSPLSIQEYVARLLEVYNNLIEKEKVL